MDKRIFGLLASTAFLLVGPGAFAAEPKLESKYNSLADWAIGEGYGWRQVDGKIVFCRTVIITGSHIPHEGCLTPDQLVAQWQAWKTAPPIEVSTAVTSTFQPHR